MVNYVRLSFLLNPSSLEISIRLLITLLLLGCPSSTTSYEWVLIGSFALVANSPTTATAVNELLLDTYLTLIALHWLLNGTRVIGSISCVPKRCVFLHTRNYTTAYLELHHGILQTLEINVHQWYLRLWRSLILEKHSLLSNHVLMLLVELLIEPVLVDSLVLEAWVNSLYEILAHLDQIKRRDLHVFPLL